MVYNQRWQFTDKIATWRFFFKDMKPDITIDNRPDNFKNKKKLKIQQNLLGAL